MFNSNYYSHKSQKLLLEPVVWFVIAGLSLLILIILLHRPINQEPVSLSGAKTAAVAKSASIPQDSAKMQISPMPVYPKTQQTAWEAQQLRAINSGQQFFITQE